MLNMVGLIEAFRASQNIGHNDLYNQLVNDHQIIETTWQNYIINSPPANLGQRKLNTLNALAERIIAANPLTNQNQVNNLKTQLNQEKQAHQQTKNKLLKLEKEPNGTLEKLIQTIKELINKPDLQGTLTAAQQKIIELEKELKDKENIPFGEDLENIKDIDLRELERILKIKLSAEIVRQMRQVANYQQWAEIRNTEIANYLNGLQNSLLVASLLAIGGKSLTTASKTPKIAPISPQKMNVVAGIIRKKKLDYSLKVLEFLPKKGGRILYKLLAGAAKSLEKSQEQPANFYLQKVE
ncbi:18772_t:CDS:2, partial [Racocetra persica]